MSGHSKWSQIKRQKGATDARRGQAFTRASNAITIAAAEGGGNPDTNFKLRLVIDAAKQINMPRGNIDRAVLRGTGSNKEGANLESITYEGFGPSGVAVLIESVTDNRSRTAQEVRSVFDRSGGSLGGPGSVAHLFKLAGEIVLEFPSTEDQDSLLLKVADAGADDVDVSDNRAVVYCRSENLENVKNSLSKVGFKIEEASLSRAAVSQVKIDDESEAAKVLSLVSRLEDLPDVQKVYANFDIPEEIVIRKAEIEK